MKELIIHIGSHKTGTTAIQQACLDHLVTTGPQAAHYFDIRPSGTRITRNSGTLEDFEVTLRTDLAAEVFDPDKAAPDVHRFVTSEEEFFWISDPDQILPFADMLKARFSKISVICYLRRPDRLALSHRKQVLEQNLASRFYGISPTPLPVYQPHFHRYFDYASKLETIWGRAFGRENLIVVNYEKPQLVDGDAVADFAHHTGLAFHPHVKIDANVSLTGARSFWGLRLAYLGFSQQDIQHILSRIEPEGAFLPSRAEAEAFVRHFAEDHENLAAFQDPWGKPFRFDTEYDAYPEQSGDWAFDKVDVLLQALHDINSQRETDQTEVSVIARLKRRIFGA